jgi:hypothetical protein
MNRLNCGKFAEQVEGRKEVEYIARRRGGTAAMIWCQLLDASWMKNIGTLI